MADAPTYPQLPDPKIEAYNSAKGWTCVHGQPHASCDDLFTVEQMRAYVDADRAARVLLPTRQPAEEGMTIAGDGAAMLGRLMREQRSSRLGIYPDGNPNANVAHAQPYKAAATPSPPVAAVPATPVAPKALASSIAVLEAWEARADGEPLTQDEGESLCLALHELKRLIWETADVRAKAAAYGRLLPYLCKTCGGFGMVGCMVSYGEGNVGSESEPCPDCAQLDFADAYQGAREDLSMWKRRAQTAEQKLRDEQKTTSRLVAELNAANGPMRMGEPAAAQPQPQPAQPLTDGSDGVPLP